MRIGVFDSGVGGKSVANAIAKEFPEHKIELREDKENLPYGTKNPDQLFGLVLPILQELAEITEVIVVACNTVSTTLINRLRQEVSVPLIAVEPMVKPAAEMTKTNIIAVCATPTTLASPRYAELKALYAGGVTVLEPDCSEWAAMIESSDVDRQKIHDSIDEVCNKGADVVVLGCTHYHWIEDILKEETRGRATVIQPEVAVIRQLKRVLEQLS